MAKKVITVLLIAVIAIGGLVSCKGAAPAASYKIGVAVAQSGIYAGLGAESMEGIQFVVDEANNEGGIDGIPIELVVYDDKSEGTEAARVATKLIEVDEVHVLIAGTITTLSNFMIPVANEAEVPTALLHGTALMDDQLGAWNFRPMGAEWDYMILSLDYLSDYLGITSLAAFIENSGYGQGGKAFLPSLCSDYNMTIVEEQYFDPGATDLTPQLTNIRNSEAEAIFIWGSSLTSGLAVKQAREMGILLPIAVSPSQSTPNMVAEFGEYYEMEPSIIGTTTKIDVWEQLPDDDPHKAACREFAQAYEERTGHRATMWNVLGAQMMLLIEDALKRADADPSNVVEARSKIRDALESTKDLELLSAFFTMSPTNHYGGSEEQKMITITFKDGKMVIIP